jgi:RNA polymerase sigma factor (sigma-70 family)
VRPLFCTQQAEFSYLAGLQKKGLKVKFEEPTIEEESSSCFGEVHRSGFEKETFPMVPDVCARVGTRDVDAVKPWEQDVQRASKRMAVRVRGCHTDGEDFAQEARIRLLIAHRKRGFMQQGYVRRVIRNAVVSAARPSIRREQRHANDVDIETIEDSAEGDNRTGPRDLVVKLVAQLPRRLRRVYELLYVKELSQREAAAKLRVTQPRVAQLHREFLEHARTLIAA